MPTVTTANLSNLVKTYYDRRMLERLVPQLMFHQFAVKKEIPKRESNQVYWHRWNLFTKGRLISESAFPTTRGMSATRVSAQLVMVGDVATITTYIDMVSINSVVEGAVDLFADSSALTVDFLAARMLLWKLTSISATLEVSSAAGILGSANYLSGAKATTISATSWQAPIMYINDFSNKHSLSSGVKSPGATGLCSLSWTPAILRRAYLRLKSRNALVFDDGYYKTIMHPDTVNALRSSSGYIDLHKYTEVSQPTFKTGDLMGGNREKGLVGFLEGFKIYESTEAPMISTSGAFGGTADGTRTQPSAFGGGRFYFTFFFGKAAYGMTDFDGGVKTFMKVPGPQSTDNPLDLYSRVGYRFITAAKVLNNSACFWIISGKPSQTGVGI